MAVKVEVAGPKGSNFNTSYGKVYEVKAKARSQGKDTGYKGDYGIRRMFNSKGEPVVVHGARNEVYDPNIIKSMGLVPAKGGGGSIKKIVGVPANVNTVTAIKTTDKERVAGRDASWYDVTEEEMLSKK